MFDAAALARDIDSCRWSDQRALRSQLEKLSRRHARGLPCDRSLTRLQNDLHQALEAVARREARLPVPKFANDLPVTARRDEIARTLAANQVTIVCGDTGSGKTTQLPQICLSLGLGVHGLIGHTQPRRVAARSVSDRIATELGEARACGYKVRFSDTITDDAFIKVMTDGILLAEIQRDPQLREYQVLIIDEAHERSLNIDFLLGHCKRLLPQRPDLKLVITSATIDPERFAAHFDAAPIVQVSGRQWPVEIRYREPDVQADEPVETSDQVGAAIDELWREAPGDVLVFLPTERDIRDLQKALGERWPSAEIVPLFGRLSANEQQRIFTPHTGLRVVLATNVAETSLTVPGIRFVVDTGTARLSRYSVHNKVQRLPIEKISQASAKQRAGRCGRVAAGVCVRLYSEEDLLSRPQFTEPEILRTNLAAVILQMAAASLGAAEDFPFLDAPQSRYINDGYRVLQELGALDQRKRITRIGRQLARLPVDPSLGRIVLASGKLNCVAEALIITAALSIQDPRERPLQHAEAADTAHREFADPDSDFLAWVNLWRSAETARRELSRNGFRRWCRERFLAANRMREWQDIHTQLRELAGELDLAINTEPADYAALHQALLNGMATHVARREEKSYAGTRNRTLHLFPGSGIAAVRPKWIVAAEIAETSRVFARCAARIEPAWIEAQAAHLLKRSYRDPHFDAHRGRVMGYEQTSLYGLVLKERRRINYARVDAALCRELFIRHALVDAELRSPPPFLVANQALVDEVHALEEKSRRRDILVDETQREAFYAELLPDDVLDGPSLKRWLQDLDPARQARLHWSREFLMGGSEATLRTDDYPTHLVVGANQLPLRYRFTPGEQLDGITLTCPLSLLDSLRDEHCDWLVPALRLEKITAMIKGLPKSLRRNFVPAPDYARACVDTLSVGGSMALAVSTELQRMTGVVCPPEALREAELPAHLRMNIELVDSDNEVLDRSRDLAGLKRRWSNGGATEVSLASLTREAVTTWDFGELPESLEVSENDLTVTVYPALCADDAGVSIRAFTNPDQAAATMRRGLRELLKLQLRKELRYIRRKLPHLERMCIWFVRVAPCERLREDLIDAAFDRVFLDSQPTPRDAEAFEQLLAQGQPQLLPVATELAAEILGILEAFHQLSNRLQDAPLGWTEAVTDIREQLDHLVYPGFISATPPEQLAHLPRYLRAIDQRLASLDHNPENDRLRRASFEALWRSYKQLLPGGDCVNENEITKLRWMLEELRVSLFAQQLGTAGKVSIARVERQIEACRQPDQRAAG